MSILVDKLPIKVHSVQSEAYMHHGPWGSDAFLNYGQNTEALRGCHSAALPFIVYEGHYFAQTRLGMGIL